MNAVVQPPTKAVKHCLHIESAAARAEAFEHRAVHVRLAVAGGVLEKQNLRRHPHEDAAVVADHRRGPRQALGKHGAFLKAPVAINILQPANAPGIGLATFRVADHFHHVQPPVRIEAHGNRISHHRFRRRQLQVKPRLHFKRPARLCHRRMRNPRQFFRIRLGLSGMEGHGKRQKNHRRFHAPTISELARGERRKIVLLSRCPAGMLGIAAAHGPGRFRRCTARGEGVHVTIVGPHVEHTVGRDRG